MIQYILYTALLLSACFAFYKILLQKETHFSLNRYVILLCMVLVFILPLLPVPQQFSLRNPDTPSIAVKSSESKNFISPIKEYTPVATNRNAPAVEIQPVEPIITYDRFISAITYLYWFGFIIFSINLLMQVAMLMFKAYARPVIRDGRFRIVEIAENKAPCSFGNSIFINPQKYDEETYKQILLHEKVHAQQRHTLDLLIAEFVLIFQWFNPFAWLWRKELENNLEYLTDEKVLSNSNINKQNYQLSLLKVAVPNYPLSLTTNYNQSLLKKRFIMMNAKKSNVHSIWKYFFLLPLMTLFVCLFNEPIAKSQTNNQKASKPKNNDDDDLKTEGNWFATIKGDTVNIQFKSDNNDHSLNGNDFLLAEFKDIPRDKEGTFTLTREAGTMQFTGKFDGNKGMGRYKFLPDKNYSANMSKEGVNVTTDNDLMVFFFINVKRSYVQMLKQNGYTKLDKDDIIPLAALDVNEAYIKSIKAAGFTDISTEDLIPFRSLGIDKAYIDEIRKAGYPNVTPDKIITFKAQGIDGKYIADYRSSVESNNDNDNGKTNQSKNKNNVAKNKNGNANKDEDDDDDIIAYKSLGIDNNYVQSLKSVGYNNLTNDNLISMKAVGVTSEFVKSFNDAGYTNISADDIVSLKAQGVEVSTIKEYKSLGLGDISIDDAVSAKATGTTPSLIKEYQSLGFKDLSLDDIISAKSTGTTPTLIKQYKNLGFKNLELEDIVSAVATSTTPSFITSMRQKGHNLKNLDEYVSLKAVLQ